VDHDDLAIFQPCVTGPAIIPQLSPTCQLADLDRDGDIDQSDFGLLQRCYSGSSLLADSDCVH